MSKGSSLRFKISDNVTPDKYHEAISMGVIQLACIITLIENHF